MQAAWYLPLAFATVTVSMVYLAAIVYERICPAPGRRRLAWQIGAACTLALGVLPLTGLDRALGTLLLEGLPRPARNFSAESKLPESKFPGDSNTAVRAGVAAAVPARVDQVPTGTRSSVLRPDSTFFAVSERTDIVALPSAPVATNRSGLFAHATAQVESLPAGEAQSHAGPFAGEVLLGGVWLLGAFVLWLRLQWAHFWLWSACRPTRRLTGGPVAEFVARWAEQLHLPASIPVYLLPGLKTPVACGIFRPTLGLPESFNTSRTDPAEQAILLHELAHLASRDPRWRYLAGLGSAVLWWHPAAWAIRRRLHWAGEFAADEASLLLADGPRHLARGLLRYGRIVSPGLSPAVAAGGDGFGSVLARRVTRLLRISDTSIQPGRRSSFRAASTATIVVTALAVVCSTVWAGAFQPLPQEEGGTVMSKFAVSWRSSLSAVALAAILSPVNAVTAEEGRREGPPPKDRPPAVERERDREPERDRGPEWDRPPKERREGVERPKPPQPEPVREEIEQAMRRIRAAQAELKERAQALRREMEGASDEAKARIREAMEGLEREMRELEAKKREVMERFRLRSLEEGPGGPPPTARLEGRLEELRREIGRAREENRMDAVERLEREIAEVERALRAAREKGPRPPEMGPPGPPPEVIERRLAELDEQLRLAHEEGKEELARQLEQRIKELHQALHARPEGRRVPPPLPPERMERIQRAAELLRREGMGDMAELLLRSARPMPPGPPGPPPPPAPRPHEPR
ncbi:MAG: M56 family metallopeptidase [Thermogutta sp.]